ncbi:unnamed protein product [Rhizoctonia solani]|uniref:Uncharacterized protein n=1 Tax=Rhizoctonia solani TaxID=456999 RepID=A0A8H3HHS0_9AGAM|nr:unnamed protein product [Rhizoctonia solani]
MEWTKVTTDLEKPMLSRRRSNWSTTGRPFPTAHHEPSKYKFGNAEKQEWHKDFEACIERCRALIPITTSAITAPTTPAPATPSATHRQSPELAPLPSTSTPIPIPESPTAASNFGGTRRLSTTPGKAGTSSLSPDTTSPVLGSDTGQPTTREEGQSPDTIGLDESINDCPNTTGPTDATRSEPKSNPDFPCRSTSGSPAPVSSVLPIKAPKARPSKGRVNKAVLLPETFSEARQTRLGAKRKAEEEATKVKRRTRSKK